MFGFRDNRYLLIVTDNYNATLPILQQQLLANSNASVIFGSSFPFDQEYTKVLYGLVKPIMRFAHKCALYNIHCMYILLNKISIVYINR